MRIGLFLFFSLFLSLLIYPQAYFTNGDARNIGGECYEITRPQNFQNGSVWYADKLDLTKNVNLEFELNFGNDQNGADGIMFVMQNRGRNALGNAGGGLGFEGFSPSLGVEFDTYRNGDFGDPAFDHIAVLRNGNVRHSGNNSLFAPVQASASQTNIKDGQNHKIQIIWNATSFDFEVWFDCEKRVSFKIDLIRNVFNGTTEVYWGFTASTGGHVNRHVACLRDDIIVSDKIEICQGESVILNSRLSNNNQYSWSPDVAIDNTNIKQPTVNPNSSQIYTVTFQSWCGETVVDTVFVEVSDSILDYQVNDTLLCDNEVLDFEIMENYERFIWSDQENTPRRQLSEAGDYTLTIINGACRKYLDFKITTEITPDIKIEGNDIVCDDETTNLNVTILPENLNFTWNDGVLSQGNRTVSEGVYSVNASNQCGFDEDSIVVRSIRIPNIELENNPNLCQGDIQTYILSEFSDYEIQWNDGSNEVIKNITQSGRYFVVVSQEQCFKSDTVTLFFDNPPRLNFPSEISYCYDQSYTFNANLPAYEITWDDDIMSQSFQVMNRSEAVKVTATNSCGTDTRFIELNLEECTCELIFPNVFSPNDDGLNDVFRPLINCKDIEEYVFRIYNRWGELLFVTLDLDKGWNGMASNQLVQPGVYAFTVSYRGNLLGYQKPFFQKGIVQVCY